VTDLQNVSLKARPFHHHVAAFGTPVSDPGCFATPVATLWRNVLEVQVHDETRQLEEANKEICVKTKDCWA